MTGGRDAAADAGRTARGATPPAWQEVYDELGSADPDTLDPADLERLAEAAFWVGRPRDAIAARGRAYNAYRDADDRARATRTAWRLFHHHFDLNETAAAGGWLKRAQRDAPTAPPVEEGYVALAAAHWALYTGERDAALSYARRAVETGRTEHDRELEALGLAFEGRVLVEHGAVHEGIELLDEAMVAVGNELGPFVTGWVYCLLLDTCQQVGDVGRAAEWTDIAVRWSEERGHDSWYPGLCRLHRCEVQSLRGEWSFAEAEARRAVEELAPFGDYLIAEGQYLTGEIRRRRGDAAGAEDAFRRAHQLGRDPQPGLALLRLAQGDAEGAATALRLALAGARGPLERARLLAAQVRAELRLGNVDAAAGAAEGLAELPDAAGALLLRGMALLSQGAVLLAKDEADRALPPLREACAICRELSCPYEAAEARVLVGVAARRAGDEEAARLEFEAAAAFGRLGAPTDAEHATSLLGGGIRRPRGLTEREAEVLRLVARGRSNREIAAELFISEHTVARHLTNIFRKLDVTSRSAATAFAFEHGVV